MKILFTKQQAAQVKVFKESLRKGEAEFSFVGTIKGGIEFLKSHISKD